MPFGPLLVDPVVFPAASSVFGRLAYRVWNEALAGVDQPGMAGDDPSGRAWGADFDAAAERVITATEAVVDGSFRLAGLLEQAGFNYAVAEDASSGRTHHVADTAAWSSITCTFGRPASAVGGGSSTPSGWSLVEDVVGYVWPNGHQDRLRSAARAWRASAAVVREAAASTWAAESSLLCAPTTDRPAAEGACRALRGHLADVASAHQQLGDACAAYADHLDAAHAAIVDELEDLLAWTAGIETAGFVGGLFSFGIAEAPAQAAEAARIGLTAARIGSVIERLRTLIATVRLTVVAAADHVAATIEALGPLLGAEPAVAGVIVVRAGELARAPRAVRAEVEAERGLSMAAVRRVGAGGMEGLSGADRAEAMRTLLADLIERRGLSTYPVRMTRAEADSVGRAWVGPGARLSSNGRVWLSRDGLRQYRLPMLKKKQARWQVNLERKDFAGQRGWPHNVHINLENR
ncbi:MAG: hypothetical protein ACTHMS_14155 [Jatrophihabitans sp.]|uniref:WXG100-like domain-containing protein n=1 Tax=Jatrophihabitans sp. TaxID=1932789 RepID=UPI003F7EF2E1